MGRIKFYKKDSRWYADLPDFISKGGIEDDCELVGGANVWIEVLAEGENQIELEVNIVSPHTGKALYKICSDENGSVYYLNDNPDFLLWLCPVLKFLYSYYPDTIYYDVIKD